MGRSAKTPSIFHPEVSISTTIHGNTGGLKADERRSLEKLGRRRVGAGEMIGLPLARALAEISGAIGRRVGVLVDRRGAVTQVAIGDASRIWVPDFGRFRAGTGRLRGLRWITTCVSGQPLTRDDLVDLVRLRLDFVVALEVTADGRPSLVHLAHAAPFGSPAGPHVLRTPVLVHELAEDFPTYIAELEEELARAVPKEGPKALGLPRAILAHVELGSGRPTEAVIQELKELARTAGLQVVATEVQRRQKPDPRTVIGRGRLDELAIRALQLDAEILLFSCDLGPAQLRTLADATELKVVDRSQLILDIFAQHARTSAGKLQVELAQLRYRLPRLAGRGTALSRLAGGIGGRGPGETKLEVDRRRVKDRIHLLQHRMAKVARQRDVRRRQRRRQDVPIVGIVGYTNAGKSTLLNALTGSEVLAEDKLFATLDPTTRRLRFPEEREIVLADTVGFIQDLPPDLVTAFKATLEEIGDASLLLHVVDISDSACEAQMGAVDRILTELDLGYIPRLLVLNKVDLPHDEALGRILEDRNGAVAVSALEEHTLRPLITAVGERLFHLGGGPAAIPEAADPLRVGPPTP